MEGRGGIGYINSLVTASKEDRKTEECIEV